MNTTPQPDPPITLFLDRTHQGKVMVQFLKAMGMCVEVHRDHFAQDEADHLWIPVCAKRGWVIISGDKGIEKAALNVEAVTNSAAKVFLLTNNNLKGVEWAACIITGREKMKTIVGENDGPFFARVTKGNGSHVCDLRFVGSGRPKEKPKTLLETIPVPEGPSTQGKPQPRSRDAAREHLLF